MDNRRSKIGLFTGPDQIADSEAALEHELSYWKQQCHESFIQLHVIVFEGPCHLTSPKEIHRKNEVC
jgi:hypothetical protein